MMWLSSPALCHFFPLHPHIPCPSFPLFSTLPQGPDLCVTAVQILGKGRQAYQADTQDPLEQKKREVWLLPGHRERVTFLKSSNVCVYSGSDRLTGCVCREGQAILAISPYLPCLLHRPVQPQLPQTYLLDESYRLPVC